MNSFNIWTARGEKIKQPQKGKKFPSEVTEEHIKDAHVLVEE